MTHTQQQLEWPRGRNAPTRHYTIRNILYSLSSKNNARSLGVRSSIVRTLLLGVCTITVNWWEIATMQPSLVCTARLKSRGGRYMQDMTQYKAGNEQHVRSMYNVLVDKVQLAKWTGKDQGQTVHQRD